MAIPSYHVNDSCSSWPLALHLTESKTGRGARGDRVDKQAVEDWLQTHLVEVRERWAVMHGWRTRIEYAMFPPPVGDREEVRSVAVHSLTLELLL